LKKAGTGGEREKFFVKLQTSSRLRKERRGRALFQEKKKKRKTKSKRRGPLSTLENSGEGVRRYLSREGKARDHFSFREEGKGGETLIRGKKRVLGGTLCRGKPRRGKESSS